ncbi:MAG: HAMP domain-containing histidine kinase [Bdellovibrio sp.]|nr:HAMP domain-containing histidine kinase [Bdellovibrio sp.]
MLRHFVRQLDLQAKISLVLVAVILPTFAIVTIAESQITGPMLEEEIRQMGIHSGKSLAAEIDSSRLLSQSNPTPAVEAAIQEVLYSQPDIVRIDVVAKDPLTGTPRLVASTVEEDPASPVPVFPIVESVTSEFRRDEGEVGVWEISVPIEHRSRDARAPKKLTGTVHVLVSTKLVARIVGSLWKTKALAACLSVVSLIVLLSYFLRKTISNDRLLKRAETQNLQLSEQLHEAHRQLLLTEKFAVMGQLTASFAHELGTPLNAIGGHLQLLKEDLPAELKNNSEERFAVIDGQLSKIASIVKGFLQSTAKPVSQKQLVDINRLIEKTLPIVMPRIDSLHVHVQKNFDSNLGPLRLVPMDMEQILLNLMTNSLDSLKAKLSKEENRGARVSERIEISTRLIQDHGQWAEITVWDSGLGITKNDLKNVFRPFFTTKRAGEGTGLGLAICSQIVHKYRGSLTLDSKEGFWTRAVIRLPYEGATS